MPRAVSSRAELGIVDRAGAVGDAFGVDDERPADLRSAAPLPRVEVIRRPPSRATSNAAAWMRRVRERRLRSGEVPAGEAVGRNAAAVRASSAFAAGSCERIAVQISADVDAGHGRAASRAARAPPR